MAGSSHSFAKFAAGTILVTLILGGLGFSVFEMVDLNQSVIVFGTGAYYISLMAILGGLLIVFWLAVIWDYVTISTKQAAEKARFMWPRYMWDYWGFNAAATIGIGVTIGVLSAYMMKFGSGSLPNFASETPIDVQSDEFIFNTQWVIVTGYLLIVFGIDLSFAYILREKFYHLSPVSELALETDSGSEEALGSAQSLIPKNA